MNLLLFILICYGLTQILVYSKLFDCIRPKHYFFHCPMCLGFWIGVFVFVMFWISGIKLFSNIYIGFWLFGFLSSGTSYALCSLIKDDGLGINIK